MFFSHEHDVSCSLRRSSEGMSHDKRMLLIARLTVSHQSVFLLCLTNFIRKWFFLCDWSYCILETTFTALSATVESKCAECRF